MSREEVVAKFLVERERHFNLPGTERDVIKTPNDWVATLLSLLGEAVNRAGKPSSNDFSKSLTKVGAVALAALEHIEIMENNKHLERGE